MSKLGKVVVLVFLISSLGMVNLPSATADGVVDQSNVPGLVDFSEIITIAPPVLAQIFTPTVPDIVAVDIFIQQGDAGVLLDIQVFDNLGNLVIEELNFNPGCLCFFPNPVHVDFTGVQIGSLSVGLENTLSVTHSISSSGDITRWLGSTLNAYPPGFTSGGGPSSLQDFYFVTYEGISVAVGSISIPIDSTPMLVAGSEMNSVWITLAIAAAIGVGILIIRRNYFSAE